MNTTIPQVDNRKVDIFNNFLCIVYVLGSGWIIYEVNPVTKERIDWTPQAFEMEYGYLPCMKGLSKPLRKKKREFYAHRKSPSYSSGRGFKKC
jgi:hypothetical protein